MVKGITGYYGTCRREEENVRTDLSAQECLSCKPSYLKTDYA